MDIAHMVMEVFLMDMDLDQALALLFHSDRMVDTLTIAIMIHSTIRSIHTITTIHIIVYVIHGVMLIIATIHGGIVIDLMATMEATIIHMDGVLIPEDILTMPAT